MSPSFLFLNSSQIDRLRKGLQSNEYILITKDREQFDLQQKIQPRLGEAELSLTPKLFLNVFPTEKSHEYAKTPILKNWIGYSFILTDSIITILTIEHY